MATIRAHVKRRIGERSAGIASAAVQGREHFAPTLVCAIQDTLGSWAVWTWQPAGFDDPFSMHDPSPAHDVLVTAWATSCRCSGGGGGGGGQGTISGRVRLVKRNGKLGPWLVKATVTAAGVSGRSKRRKPKGGYSLQVRAGTAAVSATSGRRTCHIGAPDGPQVLDVSVPANTVVPVDVFCGRS